MAHIKGNDKMIIERIKREICSLIDSNPMNYYEVRKVSEPNAFAELVITVKMLYDDRSDGGGTAVPTDRIDDKKV